MNDVKNLLQWRMNLNSGSLAPDIRVPRNSRNSWSRSRATTVARNCWRPEWKTPGIRSSSAFKFLPSFRFEVSRCSSRLFSIEYSYQTPFNRSKYFSLFRYRSDVCFSSRNRQKTILNLNLMKTTTKNIIPNWNMVSQMQSEHWLHIILTL